MSNTRKWETIREYEEIKFEFFEGIAKITINRPRYHNAFTPLTVKEMIDAMHICRDSLDIQTVILTGEGEKAFCSGGDQNVRGHGGYVGVDTVPRLNVLDLQKMIRSVLTCSDTPRIVRPSQPPTEVKDGHRQPGRRPVDD